DRLGQPVSQVVMSLVGSGVPTVSYTTSTDGTFAFTVPNGQYQLQLTTNNCSSPSGDVPGTATAGCYWDLATAAQALQVSGNRNFGDLALPSPTHVTVTVVDPAGAPVPGAAFNIGNVSCVRCGAYFPIAQGMTIGGMPITTGSTTLWNYTPPSTDASGRATILVWPSTTTGSFTVTPPPASGYGAVALNNTPLTTDRSIVIAYQSNGSGGVILSAVPDAYSVLSGGTLVISAPGVLANDSVSASATASVVTNPANGVLTAFNSNGSFTYRPNAKFRGTDSFTYKVTQNGVSTSPVDVVITVIPTCAEVSLTGIAAQWTGDGSTASVIGPSFTGTAAYTQGRVGQGFNLTPSTPLSATSVARPTTGLTLELWVKALPGAGTVQSLISRFTGPGFSGAFDDSHAYTLDLYPGNELVFEIDDNTTRFPLNLRANAPQLSDGNFHHVAATWTNSTFTLYVDGAQIATGATQGFGQLQTGGNTPVRLGGPWGFSGVIDEPAIWTRALTATEIAAIAQYGEKCS
ncbi:MAG: LamG-like jellyroll fold domain-containing protein, partial [Actinomycetota bacterium]